MSRSWVFWSSAQICANTGGLTTAGLETPGCTLLWMPVSWGRVVTSAFANTPTSLVSPFSNPTSSWKQIFEQLQNNQASKTGQQSTQKPCNYIQKHLSVGSSPSLPPFGVDPLEEKVEKVLWWTSFVLAQAFGKVTHFEKIAYGWESVWVFSPCLIKQQRSWP